MNIWVVIMLLAWAVAIALLDWQLRKSAKKLNRAIQEARRITITTRPPGHSSTAGTGAMHSSTTGSEGVNQ